jgi:hypothetical protein
LCFFLASFFALLLNMKVDQFTGRGTLNNTRGSLRIKNSESNKKIWQAL